MASFRPHQNVMSAPTLLSKKQQLAASSTTSGVIRTTPAATTAKSAKSSCALVHPSSSSAALSSSSSSPSPLPSSSSSPSPSSTSSSSNHSGAHSRRCIFDCDTNATALCRFPVRDLKLCHNWLKFFRVHPERVHTLGGLSNLRVCLKHFNEKQQMAKTRIKTTPTRVQKEALMASATAATMGDVKKRLRQYTSPKPHITATSTIIVPAPKRANSISSVTSSISHASDAHSTYSDNDSPPPPLSVVSSVANTTKLHDNNVEKLAPVSNLAALKNRKVYMITEKLEDSSTDSTHSTTGQKRKMYLIMEENTAKNLSATVDGIKKSLNTPNGLHAQAPKKLTLYADKSDGVLTEKFEKMLPEILSCIQSKDQTTKRRRSNEEKPALNDVELEETNEEQRLPITLPPKKNRNKIINVANAHSHYAQATTKSSNSNSNVAVKQTSAATPVIVSAASLSAASNYANTTCNGETLQAAPQCVPQRNINLSTDFLFLMKMLPKLESIPEPHKNHVKSCIEKIISQNASSFEEE